MTQQNNTPNETPINIVDDENNINNFLRNITNSIYNNTFFNVDETLNNQNTILHPSTSPQPPRTPPPPAPSTSPPPLPPRRTYVLQQHIINNGRLNHPNIHNPLPTRIILRPIQFRLDNISQLDGVIRDGETTENNTLNSVIQHSFQEDQVKFKQIISDEGNKMLKSVNYSSLATEEKKCGITQEEFEDNTIVIELPCKHVFCEEGIIHWLENESASCPICRFKLPSKEVRINNIEQRERSASAPPETYSDYYQTIINNIVRIRDRIEEEDTQRAIWNSISQNNDQIESEQQGDPAEQEYLSEQNDINVD